MIHTIQYHFHPSVLTPDAPKKLPLLRRFILLSLHTFQNGVAGKPVCLKLDPLSQVAKVIQL